MGISQATSFCYPRSFTSRASLVMDDKQLGLSKKFHFSSQSTPSDKIELGEFQRLFDVAN